ncbi:MAG: hypothetical protein ABSF80_07030 [Chitinispirillaceae bacterium]|jgi:hypothetical protein
MMNENKFYDELGRVPELPPGLYENIHRKIRHRVVFHRTVLALAATFILAIGTTGVLISHKGNVQGFSPDVVTELQDVHGYLNGEDLDQEYKSYVLYEGETVNSF